MKINNYFFEGYKLAIENYKTLIQQQTDIIINGMDKMIINIENKIKEDKKDYEK